MEFNMTFFLSVLGVACLIEAIPYVLFPGKTLDVFARVIERGPEAMRELGLFFLGMGIALLTFALLSR